VSYAQDGSPNHEPLIAEIMTLLSKVTERLEPEDQEMKQWMVQNFHNPVIADMLQETTLMGLRVLDAIGRLEPVNGITISEQYRIPKGTVSKITRRLITQKLISAESLANNKKEVLFRTTPLGKELFHAHRAFDEQMEKGFVRFLKRYNDDELRFIVRLLQDAVEASFLNSQLHDTTAES